MHLLFFWEFSAPLRINFRFMNISINVCKIIETKKKLKKTKAGGHRCPSALSHAVRVRSLLLRLHELPEAAVLRDVGAFLHRLALADEAGHLPAVLQPHFAEPQGIGDLR